MKRIHWWLYPLWILILLSSGSAQTLLHTTVISSGGGEATSASYRMSSTVALPLMGTAPSTSFHQNLGFWYQQTALRSYYAGAFSVLAGWNMVSVPKVVADYRKQVLYPTAASRAFVYEGSYQIRDTLQHGVGYWLKYATPQAISYSGIPITNDTVEVGSKWNIIGSVSSSVPVGSVIQDPPNIVSSQYFGYSGMYSIASSIEPGKAYWVKTKTPGKLVLSAAQASSVTASTNHKTVVIDEMNVINVQASTAGSTQSQQLLFGSSTSADTNLDKYDLPPTPPAGVPDARFATDRFVAPVPDRLAEPAEVPIRFQSNGDPLKLSWTMKEGKGVKYSLIEKAGGKVVSSHKMLSNGTTFLDVKEDRTYFLRAERVPVHYELLQNYPNPFNPTTTIRFDLPNVSKVSLTVYNLLGQRVLAPVEGQIMEEGQQSVALDASNLATGAYFYRLEASSLADPGKAITQVKKMMLLK